MNPSASDNNKLKVAQILFYDPRRKPRNTVQRINCIYVFLLAQFNFDSIPGLILKPLQKKDKLKKHFQAKGSKYMIIEAQINQKKLQFNVFIWNLTKDKLPVQNFSKQLQDCISLFYEVHGMDINLPTSLLIVIQFCQTDIKSHLIKTVKQLHLQLGKSKHYQNGWLVLSPLKNNGTQGRRQQIYNKFLDFSIENNLLFYQLQSNTGFQKVLQNISTWIRMKKGDTSYKEGIKRTLAQIKQYKIMIDRREKQEKSVTYEIREFWSKIQCQSWSVILQLKVQIIDIVKFLQNSKIDEKQMEQSEQLYQKIEEIEQMINDLSDQQELQRFESLDIANQEEDQTVRLRKLLQKLRARKKEISERQEKENQQFKKKLNVLIQLRDIFLQATDKMKQIRAQIGKQKQMKMELNKNNASRQEQIELQRNLTTMVILQSQEAESIQLYIQMILAQANQWYQMIEDYMKEKKERKTKEKRDLWLLLINNFLRSREQEISNTKKKRNIQLQNNGVQQQFFCQEELQSKGKNKENIGFRYKVINLMKDFIYQIEKKTELLQLKKRKEFFSTIEYLQYKLGFLEHNLSTFLIHQALANQMTSTNGSSP